MNARQVKANMADIARATDQNIEVVRRHNRTGVFCMSDFESVCNYVVGHKLLNQSKGKE